MAKVTIEQLYANLAAEQEAEFENNLKEPTTEDLIELRKIYCFKTLLREIKYVLDKKKVTITCDDNNYSIHINKDIITPKELADKSYISVAIKSDSLDNILISLEDPRAKIVKDFNIPTKLHDNKNGEYYMRAQREICLYLRDNEGSWIWRI